jgi:hypothetical protein
LGELFDLDLRRRQKHREVQPQALDPNHLSPEEKVAYSPAVQAYWRRELLGEEPSLPNDEQIIATIEGHDRDWVVDGIMADNDGWTREHAESSLNAAEAIIARQLKEE